MTAVNIVTQSFQTPSFVMGEITYLCDATNGQIDVTLTKTMQHGQKLSFKKIDDSANNVVITPESGATIDGDSSYTISAQYDAIQLVVQNDRWYIV
jgi:hypothetical protein